MKELIEYIKFYFAVLVATIGLWWWFTPLAYWPKFVPFLIGIGFAIWFFFNIKKHPSSHAVGNSIVLFVASILLFLYVVGLIVSFFI